VRAADRSFAPPDMVTAAVRFQCGAPNLRFSQLKFHHDRQMADANMGPVAEPDARIASLSVRLSRAD